MPRRIIQIAVLAAACCWATSVFADDPCPTTPRPQAIDEGTRLRAVVSMLVPSVYAEWRAEGSRETKLETTREPLSAPSPVSRETSVHQSERSEWEVGVTWNPVRIIERSRRLARLRRRRARRRLAPSAELCRPPSTTDATDSGSRPFEARLERAIAREKRDALDDLLD